MLLTLARISTHAGPDPGAGPDASDPRGPTHGSPPLTTGLTSSCRQSARRSMEPRDRCAPTRVVRSSGPDGAPSDRFAGRCSAPRAPDPPRRTAPEACQLLHLARSAPECTHTVGIELQPAGRSPIREQRPRRTALADVLAYRHGDLRRHLCLADARDHHWAVPVATGRYPCPGGTVREALRELRTAFREFRQAFESFDKRFESLEQRFDKRFESLEQRFDKRFDGMDERMRVLEAGQAEIRGQLVILRDYIVRRKPAEPDEAPELAPGD